MRIYVTNRLPEDTMIHWHGLLSPNGMDDVVGLNQPPIRPGETFADEFAMKKRGTFMYHPHADDMDCTALSSCIRAIPFDTCPGRAGIDFQKIRHSAASMQA